MAQVTEAIFRNGVLRPLEKLDFREKQRVRLVVEPINERGRTDRVAALERLRAGIDQMQFFLRGRLPSRDELHDRT